MSAKRADALATEVWGLLKAPRSPQILDCKRCILSIFRGYFLINLGSDDKEQVKLLRVYIAKKLAFFESDGKLDMM